MAIGINWAEIWAPVWKAVWTNEAPEPPEPPAPRATGAGRSSGKRRRVIEVDGRDIVVSSTEEAHAVLAEIREAAQANAALAIKRANSAQRRPTRKVIADARRLLVTPDIKAPEEFTFEAAQLETEIADLYRTTLMTVEIAALMAKRQRMEEDDEDVLLLLV